MGGGVGVSLQSGTIYSQLIVQMKRRDEAEFSSLEAQQKFPTDRSTKEERKRKRTKTKYEYAKKAKVEL